MQGRSSSLRNILGCEVWGGREDSSGGRQEGNKPAETIRRDEGGAGVKEKQAKNKVTERSAQGHGHRSHATGRDRMLSQQPHLLSLPAQVSLSSTPPKPSAAIYSLSLPPSSEAPLGNLPSNLEGKRQTNLGSNCLLPDHGGCRGSRGSRDVRHHLTLEMSQRTEKSSIQYSNSVRGTARTKVGKDDRATRRRQNPGSGGCWFPGKGGEGKWLEKERGREGDVGPWPLPQATPQR